MVEQHLDQFQTPFCFFRFNPNDFCGGSVYGLVGREVSELTDYVDVVSQIGRQSFAAVRFVKDVFYLVYQAVLRIALLLQYALQNAATQGCGRFAD